MYTYYGVKYLHLFLFAIHILSDNSLKVLQLQPDLFNPKTAGGVSI